MLVHSKNYLFFLSVLLTMGATISKLELSWTIPKKEGEMVPQVTFKTRTRIESTEENPFDWKDVTTDDLFKGKRVVLFALPGAFTPTCSSTHLPGYHAKYDEVKKLGIDDIYCLSVNDAFVMRQWGLHQGYVTIYIHDYVSHNYVSCWCVCVCSRISLSLTHTHTHTFILILNHNSMDPRSCWATTNPNFRSIIYRLPEDMTPGSLGFQTVKLIPDGAALFTRGMGMSCIWESERGFGERSWRYSMVVQDGKIEKMFVEGGGKVTQNSGPDPFEVSDVDTMLAYLQEKQQAATTTPPAADAKQEL